MKGNDSPLKVIKSENFPSETDKILLERVRLEEMESLQTENNSTTPETKPQGGHITSDSCKDEGISSLLHDVSDPQQMQDSMCIAVRSRRQSERRAKRARAATNAASRVISVKSASSGKRKRPTLQEIDYSDPLRYLRATTNNSKLLTASEELELSKGIQVGS